MRRVVWLLALAVAAWVLVVLTAPVLPAWPAAFVYAVSSLICHQLPERSLYWGAVQFAVCARCTGVYTGAALAAVAAGALAPRRLAAMTRYVRPLLIAGALPTMVTVAAEWLDAWMPSHAARLVAGVPLGASVMLAVAMALIDYEPWLSRPAPTRPPPMR